ncbi:MAG: hypothetical protein WC975_05790 [Phycisphaerae bacterium]
MDFVKKNLILVVSGAVALLALAGLVLGIGQIGGVAALLSPAQQEADTVKSLLTGVPVAVPGGETKNLIPTQGVIENLKKVGVLFKVQGNKALQEVLQENIGYDPVKKTLKRGPILDGIFPQPVPETLSYKFPVKYKEAINSLLVKMQAGGIPNAKEIAGEKEWLLRQQGLMSEDITKPKGTKLTRGKPGATFGIGQENMDVQASFGAAMKKAEKIKVYCEPFSSLDIISEVYSPTTGRPPAVEDMWWAQLSYWIQDDIANAVAQTNASAKNVLDSVVKQINKVQVMHGYLLSSEEGKVDFVGATEFSGPESFSGLKSDQYCDVLRFSIVLTVDSRKIPSFIDAMYRQSHYLLYMWNIEAVNPSSVSNAGNYATAKTPDLYQFGSAPVVKLTTYWEGYLLRDFYHWGIVGYGVNDKGKSFVSLYNGTTKELEDMDKRTGLTGLMPKTIRQALGSEPGDNPEEPPK